MTDRSHASRAQWIGLTTRVLRIGLGALVLSTGLGALVACTPADPSREAVRIGGEWFQLERATDPVARRQGLMHRAALAPDGGLLFVFPDSRLRAFWMGHCLIDIDVLFLDAGGRVTAIHAMSAEPPQQPGESDAAYRARMPSYPSRAPARYAIELARGSAARLGVAPGDVIELDHARLAALAH